jgi:beta-mannosidase
MVSRLLLLGLLVMMASCTGKTTNNYSELNLDWKFSRTGSDQWYPAQVPGSVQEDLLLNALIPDPFIGSNEDSIQWVEEESWSYRAEFKLSDQQLTYKNLELIFEGLDTYATVYLNDSLIQQTDNMFLAYRTNIRDKVSPGLNKIRIDFESPIQRNKQLVSAMPYELPTSESAKIKVSSYVRKAAYQFGWDFAPRVVTSGIWRPIKLEAWNEVVIRDVHFVAVDISDHRATYTVRITIESISEEEYELSLNGEKTSLKLTPGINVVERQLSIEKPIYWWPNGLGEQHLYTIETAVYKGNQMLDSDRTNLGVRTIKLVQEKDDIGTSFKFEVNGREVFMKGANWSPLSSYPGSIADSVYVNRLHQVRDANMNMLRVWGGGIYERDLFYDLCDQYGILVWQDFMFANTMYPPLDEFTANVRKEVKYQVNRLKNHPSLALLNGNNEIDVAWKNWGWQDQYAYTEQDSAELRSYYEKIFHELMPGIINGIDSNMNYSSTSPISNWGTAENFNHSSMHYWGVWHGGDLIADYKDHVGRFVSEYGFQSYPNYETFKPYLMIDDFTPEYNASLHQKSYVGNKLIIKEAEDYFGAIEGLEDFITKSQKVQAIAYKNAIEAHRLSDKCDGSLFWQLNDCWPGPSWSVIDFKGKGKLAYDVIKDRYKSAIVVINLEEDDLNVFLINDDPGMIKAQIIFELFKANGDRVWVTSKEVEVSGRKKISIYRSHLQKVLDGFRAHDVVLKVTLSSEGNVRDIEYKYFAKPKSYSGSYDLVGLK